MIYVTLQGVLFFSMNLTARASETSCLLIHFNGLIIIIIMIIVIIIIVMIVITITIIATVRTK